MRSFFKHTFTGLLQGFGICLAVVLVDWLVGLRITVVLCPLY